MRTQIFEYKGYVGILSSVEAEGLINDPTQPGQLGFVVDLSKVDVSPKAAELLKRLKKRGGSFSELMLFQANDGMKCLGWMGGPMTMITRETYGDRDYTPSIITETVEIEAPDDFKAAIDSMTEDMSIR